MSGAWRVVRAETVEQVERARVLFGEYGALVEARACTGGMDVEVGSLPGVYGPPSGALLLGMDADGEAIGCVGLRELGGATDHGLSTPRDGVRRAELKRLYVRAGARAHGLGRALTGEAIRLAREAGYGAIRLDTLASMREAIALYRSMGFVEMASGVSCAKEALFFELGLWPRLEIEDATGTVSRVAGDWLRAQGERVMGELARRHGAGGSVRVRVIGDTEMRALHGKHSGDPTTTDVLTFDLREGGSGQELDVDVLVCADEARRQAELRGHAPEAELLLYVLHACLHCLGHDDGTEEASERMHGEEDAVLRAIGLPPVYSTPLNE